MRALLTVILCAAFLAACSGPKGSQQADLAFWFRCDARANHVLEQKLDAFLTSKGFRVLNLGAIQREKNIAVFDLNMTAIDTKHRIIDIHAFPSTPGSQSVGLYSPPPTQRDTALEESLLEFSSTGLACQTDQVARHDNGLESKDMHEWNVRRIEGLFKEAAKLRASGAQPSVPADGAVPPV
jgi:hypothetical protein